MGCYGYNNSVLSHLDGVIVEMKRHALHSSRRINLYLQSPFAEASRNAKNFLNHLRNLKHSNDKHIIYSNSVLCLGVNDRRALPYIPDLITTWIFLKEKMKLNATASNLPIKEFCQGKRSDRIRAQKLSL